MSSIIINTLLTIGCNIFMILPMVLLVFFTLKKYSKSGMEIVNYCKTNNFQYYNDVKPELPSKWCDFKILTKDAENKFGFGIVGNKNGIKFIICNYTYGPGGDDSGVTPRTICILTYDNLELPHFLISEKSILSKVFNNSNLPVNDPEFSSFLKNFIIETKDRKTFSILKNENFSLIKQIHRKGYEYEAANRYLVVSIPGLILNIDKRLELLNISVRLLNTLISSSSQKEPNPSKKELLR